jgi:cobalt/nickel transport system ATP-binding protein
MTPLIEVRGLRFQYEDGTQALDGIDFTLQAGETVALFGANGSGKTTFVLHLNGILRGEGDVTVCGMPLSKATLPAVRAKIGMVFQDSDEQLFMPTVLEDVAFGPLNQGSTPHEAVHQAEAALEQVGMQHAAGRAPYHLSAGEKKRVALAGVLAMNPEILVLDEPSTFLDPPGQSNLVHLLKTLPQAKLIITHDTYFAAALATRAVFFDKGKLVADGLVDEIVQRFHWNYSALPADLRYSAQRRF